MSLFLASYFIELKREEWCIKYLDIDNEYPDNCLKEIIIKEKKLDKYMDRINIRYYNTIRITSFVYAINLFLTIKVLIENYHSNSTISCFISFSLLVMMKLYNSLFVAYESVKNDKMMSAYMNEFVSFNVLDQDYVEDKYSSQQNFQLEDPKDIEDDKGLEDDKGVEDDKVIKEEEIVPIVK